jgi:undecaprenyl-diphosphatase
MSYLQAVVIALVQGVTELFPISSLGHSVLVPAWIGGSWQTLVTQSSIEESESSFYLAYIVALHCATAIALLWYFREDWVRIARGFFRSVGRSVRRRRLALADSDERLAWMIVVATIPVGLTGIALEHAFRVLLAKPTAAATFLFVNGLVLLLGERLSRRSRAGAVGLAARSAPVDSTGSAGSARRAGDHARRGGRREEDVAVTREADARISRLTFPDAFAVGALQIAALFAGISRSGVSMVGGLWRGLDHEDAARFGFLLATPVILAAGVYKLPSLTDPAAAHIHGQVLVGVVVAGLAAYVSVRFLMRWFQTRTLIPFAIYCLVVGAASMIRFAA